MSQGELFNESSEDLTKASQEGELATETVTDHVARADRVVASALWASWADALGFISELTNAAGLKRRLQGDDLQRPVEWKRRVGGRGGPDVVLPTGTYSDDTQLRLATGRCISGRGFDVEAFAHVELTAWLAYALGGGVGTKAAAARMMKPAAVWYAGQAEGWTRGGGNGAAMRIQPHVWASSVVAGPGPWLAGLLADACTTHAHPRALLGAVYHAYALSIVTSSGQIPAPSVWIDLLDAASGDGLDEMRRHPEISDYWIGAYDKAAQAEGAPGFADSWEQTTDEMRNQLKFTVDQCNDAQADANWYSALVSELGLNNPSTRGSGSATVIAALALAWVHMNAPDAAALVAAADTETDTDTIATMAAALAGAALGTPPEAQRDGDDFSDWQYIRGEAERLAQLASGDRSNSAPVVRYPDLLTWTLPKAQVDLVGTYNDELWLAGLSRLRPTGRKPAKRGEFVWQWFVTDWDQHLLAKVRTSPKPMPPELVPAGPKAPTPDPVFESEKPRPHVPTARRPPPEVDARVTLESVHAYLQTNKFEPGPVGYAVTQMARTSSEAEFASFTRLLRQWLRSDRASSAD